MTRRLGKWQESIARLGLDPATVEGHAALIAEVVRHQRKPTFKVIDTCRLDNGALRRLPVASGKTKSGAGYLAFVPAAGAASRYSGPLSALLEALEKDDRAEATKHLRALADEGAGAWPLPAPIKQLIANPHALEDVPLSAMGELSTDLHLPKALMPCVEEGMSFLEMKDREHTRIPGLEGQLFVTPPGAEAAFNAALTDGSRLGVKRTAFLPQGPLLSTIRFHPDGSPVVEADGNLSPVPAGHGTLARLFPTAGKLFPTAHSLFIRNIDNIMGTGEAALTATRDFLSAHTELLQSVRAIRTAMRGGSMASAADHANRLLHQFGVKDSEQKIPSSVSTRESRSLWAVQIALFHADTRTDLSNDTLARLYERPVTMLGQVPNTGKDIGGTPCFVTGKGPRTDKVCIEVPHVSAADKRDFLANPLKATHFNPVFAAVEITDDADYYASRNQDYWLLSEKNYRGHPVLYIETVLYELIGNSGLVNCMFVEVPRLVFNPHKTLQDARGRRASHWLVP